MFFSELAFAQGTNSACPTGYTRGIDPETKATTCFANCDNGSAPDSNGYCVSNEIIVTAPKATGKTFADVVDKGIVPFVDTFIIPLLYALIFLLFIFGVFRYFFTGGEENREKGKQFVVWSLIGMVAVFSVWGIINLLLSTLAF